MRRPLIVVDDLTDWAAFASGPEVISAAAYLSGQTPPAPPGKVINLCRDAKYLRAGYYVSLLAEARGGRALPSVRTLLELSDSGQPRERLTLRRPSVLRGSELPERLTVYFGRCAEPRLNFIGEALFNRYPAPLLQATLAADSKSITCDDIVPGQFGRMDDIEETRFGEALDRFSSKIWRNPSPRGRNRYDLAILVDPNDSMPPSDGRAIKKFERAARGIGFDVETITAADSPRLLEFDALFIRTTTAINHYTYQMARRGASEGMAVIDDPDSIMRCCNKVFLHDLLHTHRLPMPPSRLLMSYPEPDYPAIVEALGLPMVLKIPDGSFSRGVYKVNDLPELEARAKTLHDASAVIIAQAFVPTDFDWRIGILDGRPLYACRYYMARGHWQIINHDKPRRGGRVGGYDCIPISAAPAAIVRTAVKAAKLVGDGLYGVDLKEIDGKAMVIEINDNPSLESDVEDQILGDELYRQIMLYLMHRSVVR